MTSIDSLENQKLIKETVNGLLSEKNHVRLEVSELFPLAEYPEDSSLKRARFEGSQTSHRPLQNKSI